VNILGFRGNSGLLALVGVVLIAIALVNGRAEVGIVGLVVLLLAGRRLLTGRGG
jgi:hypothetical protein